MSTLTVGLVGITGKFGRLLASSLPKNEGILLHGFARDQTKVIASIAESPRVQLFKGEAFDSGVV